MMSGLRNTVEQDGLSKVRSVGCGDVSVDQTQIWLLQLMPLVPYLRPQNMGFAYTMRVVGGQANK